MLPVECDEEQDWLSRFELPQCLDRLLAERPAPGEEASFRDEDAYLAWTCEAENERLTLAGMAEPGAAGGPV